MKKWLWVVPGVIIILFLVFAYFFIPKNITVSSAVYFHGNSTAVSRSLHNEGDWAKWWPAKEVDLHNAGFSHNQYTFRMKEKFYNAASVLIQKDGVERESRINIFPVTSDSLYIVWKYEFQTSSNPLVKVFEYLRAVHTKKEMDTMLSRMKSFLMNKENIYGIRIAQIMSGDSTLITTKFETDAYPTTTEIYHAIYELKNFVALHHAKENNFPMKVTNKLKDKRYETMVAIPINKALDDKGKFILKRYVPWKEMMGEVTGGDSAISRGFQQFKIFLDEYHYTQMTAPFESLVTDRSLEKDSSKWITRFIVPIP